MADRPGMQRLLVRAPLRWIGGLLLLLGGWKALGAPIRDISFQLELQHALDRALPRLVLPQETTPAERPANEGKGEDPMVDLAWCVLAWTGDPSAQSKTRDAAPLAAALQRLASAPRTPEGWIASPAPQLATAMAVVALGAPRDLQFDAVRLSLRRALLKSTGAGGFGAGADGKGPMADLETTQWALRALRGMEPPSPAPGVGGEVWDPETRMRQAAGFVWACQVSTNAPAVETRGGFLRSPGNGIPTLATTSDGILAALFLGTATGDDRLALAMDWIQRRMALELRPGGDEANRFRGMPACALALSAIRQDLLRHPDGRIEDWRYALAKRLLDLQEADGRWGSELLPEAQRNRVTAQAAFALEIVFHALDH